MTTQPKPADLLAPLLALVAKWRERAETARVKCELATFHIASAYANELQSAIDSLAAHRGEVVPYGYVMRCDSYRRQPEFYDTKPGFVPPISTLVPVYLHPPQAQAGAGDAWRKLAGVCNRMLTFENSEYVPNVMFEQLRAELAALEAKP